MVYIKICLHVDVTLIGEIRDCTTDKAVWETLEKYYEETALPNKLFLRNQFNNAEMTK